MNRIKQFFRLIKINHVLAKNGLDQVIVSIHLFAPFRFISYLNPWNWWRREQLTPGQALRKSLEELGPIFIKFGQALSTRPDILPVEVAKELSLLQDRVAPFTGEKVLKIVESAYRQKITDVFAEFDLQALASASMAQVHAATLKSGERVVVKVLRPKMRNIIKKDIGILKVVAKLVERYIADSKRFKPREVVSDFEQTLLDELDLAREAANACQLRRNFKDSPLLYIPEVYWDYTKENVLVLERISGIPIYDIQSLKDHGVNLQKLAERGVEIFFTQVFRDCFFHADMHPGNIFVSYNNPDNPQCICVDFGIIGTLNDNDKRYLAENLVAFFNRDYRRVAVLHIESGWVANTTRVDEFESAMRTVCEPIFERPLKDISFGLVVLQLFRVARRFNMEIQPQLILLQKTMLAVEGIGRQLYPELDIWVTTKPILERWLRNQFGPKSLIKSLRANIPSYIQELPHIPRLIHDVLTLSKENLQQQKDAQCKIATPTTKPWRHGFVVGMITASAIIAGMCYFGLLSTIILH